MSANGVEALRSEYVTARRDLARAEADLSQGAAALAAVEAAHAAAKRGDGAESVDRALADLEAEIREWTYDTDEITEPDRPTFDDFDIGDLDDLRDALATLAAKAVDAEGGDTATERFETLASLLETAFEAAGGRLDELTKLLGAVRSAVEEGESDRTSGLATELVTALEDGGVTVADLSKLLDEGRGPTNREHLARLRTEEGRNDVLGALEKALAEPEETAFAAPHATVAGALRAIESFAAGRRAEIADVTDALTDEYPTDLDDPLDGMAGETPVLLLPTRLETRFADVSDPNGPDVELKVRVYPDDIHVDTHERELTAEEVRWGVHFWEQVWWANHTGTPEEIRAAVPEGVLGETDPSAFPDGPAARHGAVLERAWAQLAERFGPERAAWVKRELAPDTGDALLDGPNDASAADPDPVDFDALRADADRRPESWTRAPRARGLPDQWVAFAETDGTTVTARSEPVRRPLTVGPQPDRIGSGASGSDPNAPGDPEADALGEGELSWVFDFDEAVDAGMGFSVPLTADQAAAGVDRLVVLGVSTALDGADGSDVVGDLLDAHRHTDGLSLVERGTPTNDTRKGSAAESPSDRPTPFALACGDARGPPSRDSDAARAARLLGLDDPGAGPASSGRALGRAVGGHERVDAAAAAMNAALWPATWGYYLPHMLAPERWTGAVQPRPDFLAWLESYRRHFVEYVRAGGPLPTLRVGDQPYGVLPTTDLDAWQAVDAYATDPGPDLPATEGTFTYERLGARDAETDLVERLRSVRPAWADAVESVPSIETPDDPETVVTDLLAMAGTSYGYRLRELLGPNVMADLVGSSSTVSNAVGNASSEVTNALRQYVANAETPRVGELLATGEAPSVHAALVADDLDDYLRTLRTEPHGALRAGPPGSGLSLDEAPNLLVWLVAVLFDADDDSLLEVLLYFGLMEEYRLARVRMGHHYDDFRTAEEYDDWSDTVWSLVPEPETYDDGDLTLWSALDDPVADGLAKHPAVDAETTYGELLRREPAVDGPFSALLDAFSELGAVEEDLAERLLRETLDLASHRFDAWATSVATRRLDGMREAAGDGLYVGAYGYVENLRRESGPRSEGYVHAPSVGQATTAAVLRSGFEASDGDALAVDLSAERVRDAVALIEAVRAGQPLGELLGYRFERTLRENHTAFDLERYVPALRSVAPLVDGKLDRQGMSDADAVAERDVVDGVALVDAWRDGSIPWAGTAGTDGTTLPSDTPGDPTYDEYEAIRSELDALEAALDAVSDVLTAESVHQLVGGNPERAGGSLDALSRGETPPDLSVTETPRTGTATTHRLLTFLDPDGSTWGKSDAPRAVAEPALNEWAGTLLGDPTRVVCRVAFEPRATAVAESGPDSGGSGEGGGDTDATVSTPAWRVTAVRLSDLDLCPLDLVYLVEGDAEAWASELEERIGYRVRRRRSDVAPDGEVRISFAPPSEWPDPAALGVDPDADVGFRALLEAVRGVREVVTSARAADARDVSLPGEAGSRGLLATPLIERAEAVEPALRDAVDAMDDLTAAFAVPEADEPAASEYDRLVDLTDTLSGVSAGPIAATRRGLSGVDPDAAGADLLALVAVAAGDAVALARDERGDVAVDPSEPTLAGLSVARPDTPVEIEYTVNGRVVEDEARVGRDGVFETKLPEDVAGALSRDDTFDVDLTVDGATASVSARYDRPSGRRSFVGPALAALAAVADDLATLERSTAGVRTALGALDESTVRDALARVDVDDWPDADARTHLDTALGVGSVGLPGFDDPDGWDELGPVLLAAAEGRLSREALLDSELREFPRDRRELAGAVEDFAGEVADGLDEFEASLDAAAADPASAFAVGGCEAMRTALVLAADHGIHGALPAAPVGATTDDIAALVRQADSVAGECTERLGAAAAATAAGASDAADQRDRLEALFEDAFTVLAPFTASNPGELDAALDPAHEATLLGEDALAAETWFQRVARIRDVPRDLGRALTYGESFGDLTPSDGSRFRVAQLPYAEPDAWVGRPEAWDGDPPTGKLSLVAHVRGDPDATGLVGLFVDEFVETVPSGTETTGMSVHYDKPGNRAPQSMLLAAPPTDEDWSLRTLADCVVESVDLAKARTVDRDALSEVGHLLPAMTLATNDYGGVGPDTASVDAADLGPPWWADDQGGER